MEEILLLDVMTNRVQMSAGRCSMEVRINPHILLMKTSGSKHQLEIMLLMVNNN